MAVKTNPFMAAQKLTLETRVLILCCVFATGGACGLLVAMQCCRRMRRCLQVVFCGMGSKRGSLTVQKEATRWREGRAVVRTPAFFDRLLPPWSALWSLDAYDEERERLRAARGALSERERRLLRKEAEVAREERRQQLQLRQMGKSLRESVALLHRQYLVEDRERDLEQRQRRVQYIERLLAGQPEPLPSPLPGLSRRPSLVLSSSSSSPSPRPPEPSTSAAPTQPKAAQPKPKANSSKEPTAK